MRRRRGGAARGGGLLELHLEDNVFLVPLLFEALAQVRSRDVFAQLRVLGAHTPSARARDPGEGARRVARRRACCATAPHRRPEAHISLPCFGEGVRARERSRLRWRCAGAPLRDRTSAMARAEAEAYADATATCRRCARDQSSSPLEPSPSLA